MAGDLPFLDSAQHYNSAQSIRKWFNAATVTAGAGRRGGAAITLTGTGIIKTFDSEYTTLYMGGAFKSPASPFKVYNTLSGVSVQMHAIGDGRYYMVGVDPSAPLVQNFGGNDVTPPILGDRWYYLEMKAVCTSTTISVIFRINEQVVLTETYTLYGTVTSHASWASVNIQGLGGGGSSTMCDFYVNNSGFYGDVNIDAIKPNAVGSSSMWTPSPAVANWNDVKEVIADDNTSTVSSLLPNDIDLYGMEDIPTGLVVKATQGLACVKKSDAGTATFKLQYGSGGGAVLSDEFFPSEIDYIYMRDGREIFVTSADVNGIEFGYKRIT